MNSTLQLRQRHVRSLVCFGQFFDEFCQNGTHIAMVQAWRLAWVHGCQNAPENSPHLCARAKERSNICKWNGSIFILHQPQLRVLPKITFEVTVRLFHRNPCRLVTSQSALNSKTSYEVCGINPKNNMVSISAPAWKNICSQQSYHLQTNSSKKGFQFGYSTWICQRILAKRLQCTSCKQPAIHAAVCHAARCSPECTTDGVLQRLLSMAFTWKIDIRSDEPVE